jgi:hypothetical protein
MKSIKNILLNKIITVAENKFEKRFDIDIKIV